MAPLVALAESDKAAASPQELGHETWEAYAEWWWRSAHDAMRDHGLRREDVRAAVAAANCTLRLGCGAPPRSALKSFSTQPCIFSIYITEDIRGAVHK